MCREGAGEHPLPLVNAFPDLERGTWTRKRRSGRWSATLTLYTPDGREKVIPKERIAERELLDQSAMPPSFPLILSARDVADITAYLMTQKTDPDAEGEDQP